MRTKAQQRKSTGGNVLLLLWTRYFELQCPTNENY